MTMLSRRKLLLSSVGLAAASAGAIALSPTAARACEAVHTAATAKYNSMARGVAFAAGNVVGTLADMACPCCGEPLVLFGGKLAI
ncbi:MAG: hypothetical protein VW600_08020 [Ferrovibrio sp.]